MLGFVHMPHLTSTLKVEETIITKYNSKHISQIFDKHIFTFINSDATFHNVIPNNCPFVSNISITNFVWDQ